MPRRSCCWFVEIFLIRWDLTEILLSPVAADMLVVVVVVVEVVALVVAVAVVVVVVVLIN